MTFGFETKSSWPWSLTVFSSAHVLHPFDHHWSNHTSFSFTWDFPWSPLLCEFQRGGQACAEISRGLLTHGGQILLPQSLCFSIRKWGRLDRISFLVLIFCELLHVWRKPIFELVQPVWSENNAGLCQLIKMKQPFSLSQKHGPFFPPYINFP